MGVHQPWIRGRVRRFSVVEDSMLPALRPGDGLLAIRSATLRRGQLRVFEHPQRPGFWLVKRVGDVARGRAGDTFLAESDNPTAPGIVDSRRLGPVPVAGSYRVVKVVQSRSYGRASARPADAPRASPRHPPRGG